MRFDEDFFEICEILCSFEAPISAPFGTSCGKKQVFKKCAKNMLKKGYAGNASKNDPGAVGPLKREENRPQTTRGIEHALSCLRHGGGFNRACGVAL